MRGTRRTHWLAIVIFAVGVLPGVICKAEENLPLRFVDPDREAGTSAAVVVPPDVALAHTALMLPVNSSDEVVEKGNPAEQAARVLSNLNWALAAAGSGREYMVKLNVYAAHEQALAAARQRVAEAFPGPARPAATFILNKQPREGVLVTMDAVAVAPLREPDRVTHFVSDQLPTAAGDAHVSVMPPGDVFYVSGQVRPGETLEEAVQETMRGLHETLEHFGLDREQVVQVKAFIQPMAEAEAAWEAVAATYDQPLPPPTVITEWQASLPRPTEIELIAVNPGRAGEGPVEPARYLTPPWMDVSPVFSRVAAAHSDSHHGWIYFSGMIGDPDLSPEQQVDRVFDVLQQLCEKTGGDFQHLIKATYYVTDRAMTRALGARRPDFYDPQRPPAASLVIVRGAAVADAIYTLDMIGIKID